MAVAAPRPSNFNHKFSGCSSIADYAVLSKLGEGTFGEVHKARSKAMGTVVALKKILMHNEKDGFPVTAIREIKLLKMLSHINILRLVEMAVERPPPTVKENRKKAVMYMVTPYMEHDLSGLLTNPDVHLTEPQIKCYMLQLLEGLRYLHNSQILHRDMKAANLLISNRGILQIADFGLARHYDEPPPSGVGNGYNDAKRDYTALVVTRWYRPPELLLGLRKYTPAIDLWGVGCVFGEMFKRVPILQGGSDVAQAQMIFDLVGSPTEDSMPGWSLLPGCEGIKDFEISQSKINQRFRELSASACSLLNDLLKLNWRKRITAMSALQHPYFRAQPLPAKPHELPRFDDSHELDHRKSRGQKGPPPAPAGGTVGIGVQGPGEWDGPTAHIPANGSGPMHVGKPGSQDTKAREKLYESRKSSGPPSATTKPPGWTVAGKEQSENRTAGLAREKDSYVPSYQDRSPREEKSKGREWSEREPSKREYRDRDYDRRERERERDRDRGFSYRDRHDRRDSRRYDEDNLGNEFDYDRNKSRRREADERAYRDRNWRTSRSRSPDHVRRRDALAPYARR